MDKQLIDWALMSTKLHAHRTGSTLGIIRYMILEVLEENSADLNEKVKSRLTEIAEIIEISLEDVKDVYERTRHMFFAEDKGINFSNFQDTIEKNKTFCNSRNVILDIKGFENLKPAKIRMSFLVEIIDELISNSVKAMPNGGIITIEGKASGNEIVIDFSDTGFGIRKEDQAQIFDFEFSNWPDANGSSGTGLYYIKRIVESCDGNLTVHSDLNQGTKFILSLPIKEATK